MIDLKKKLHPSWLVKLQNEFKSPYFESLNVFLTQEINKETIYPDEEKIFEAFNQTHFENVKAVIIGQDPYHGVNQAHGLSFSTEEGFKLPPSLRNIFKELNSDLKLEIPKSGNLSKWAKEGVLLMNSILTVRAKTPGSHQNKGWEKFTDSVINLLSNERENIVFILWGKYAQEKESLIDTEKHFIIKSAHPSPLSAHNGFFGSKPFSKCNDYLESSGVSPVNWSPNNT